MLASHPFNIRILVAEGRPDGLRLVEKSNWVGLGVICPRNRYAEVKNRDEFSRSAVYILEGEASSEDQPLVYIGEAETIRRRLDNHYANKDFWQRVVLFTTRGNQLNKTEVKYLEASLLERARNGRRCRLENANSPQMPVLSEADRAEVEGYLREMLLLLPVIGLNFFESISAKEDRQKIYHLKRTDWDAKGHETDNGFLVYKGSVARHKAVSSISPPERKRRSRLIEDGILVEDNGALHFKEDYEFSSPSQAATVCAGRNSNGLIEWKDSNGVTLKENRQREVKT